VGSNAYLLALGSLILVGGSLGDLLGERRVFSIGVAGFGLVSLLCAISPTIGSLIACRALEGGFGALLTPSALAAIVAAFPREERGGAIGSWTAWSGIAAVVGPLVGGFLVDAVSWRLIFAVNVPFGVLAGWAAKRLPAGAGTVRSGERIEFDFYGLVMLAAGVTLVLLGASQGGADGWGSAACWAPAWPTG